MDFNSINYQSPLRVYVENSGKHPISLQGHYDHWLKYDGKKKPFLFPEQEIKTHLKSLRYDRSRTHLKLKRKQEKTFLSKNRSFINSKKSVSKNSNYIFDIADLYDDLIETGSTWWRTTPLPDIVRDDKKTDIIENEIVEVQQPFLLVNPIITRATSRRHFSNIISSEILNEFYNSRTFHIYVACNTYDMKNEILKLEMNVWPNLRELCLKYNQTLIIHNLHNFSDELLSLGIDKYRKEITRSIEICTNQNSTHFQALILFGDEYEEKDIPQYLSEAQLEFIKNNMKSDIDRITYLQNKISVLKQKQLRIKQQNFKRENTVDNLVDMNLEDSNRITKTTQNDKIDKINAKIISSTTEMEILNNVANIKLINQWYRKTRIADDIYYLVSESEIIKDLKNPDFSKRKLARLNLKTIKTQICNILQKYAPEILENEQTLFELEMKLLQNIIRRNKCLVISRTFTDKPVNEKIQNHRNDLLGMIIDKNQIRYELELHKTGTLAPDILRNHASYIDQIGSNIKNLLEQSILDSIAVKENEFSKLKKSVLIDTINETDQLHLFNELAIQKKILDERMCPVEKLFPEMIDFIDEIQQDIMTTDNRISCIISSPISGKTNIICHLISRFEKIQRFGIGNKNKECLLIYRLCGTSFQNINMTNLLKSICCQLLYNTKLNWKIPDDINGLKVLFSQILLIIDFEILIFIDGIENLKELKIDSNIIFNWLPFEYENFKIIFSSDKDCSTYNILSNYLKEHQINLSIYSVPQLTNSTIELLIKNFKLTHFIDWTNEQNESLLSNIELNKTIGFVLSNLRVAKVWTMSSSIPKLGNKLEQNILYNFARLEDQFGEPIIRRLLGYITSFSSGVSITELVDIMTFDETIKKFLNTLLEQNEYIGYTYSLLRCVFTELDDFLGLFFDECGIELIKWRHISYHKAASSRYLLQKDKAPSYHHLVSTYYMNNENDKNDLLKLSDSDFNLPTYSPYLIKQNIIFDAELEFGKSKFNQRRVLQLPYHLMQYQNQKLLKNICIFNFYWLQSAIMDFGVDYVINIIKFAIETEPEDLEYPFLIEILKLCSENITSNPSQLGNQILGRITNIIKEDRQTKEVRKFINLDGLYLSILKNNWIANLVPSKTCMKSPTGLKMSVIGLYFGNITCILTNTSCTKLFASTDTGILYIWDISKNILSSLIFGIGNNVFQMIFNETNNKLVMALPDLLEVWDISQKVLLIQLNVYYDPYCLTVSADRSLFSAFFYGTFWISTWSFETLELILSKHLIMDTTVNNNKGEIVTSITCNKFIALAAIKFDSKAALIDIKTGEINPKQLICKEFGSAIIKVGISINYYVLCSRGFAQMNIQSVIHYIDLYDIESLQLIRRISGCFLDSLISLSINSVGSHAITLNNNLATNITDISIWNLETEEHKHCSEMENIYEISEAKDFVRIFLSSSNSGKIYKVNIQPALQAVKSKSVIKRENYFLRKFESNDQYVFLTNSNNSSIDVYNMLRNKKAGRKSWSIANIVESSDIILPFKEKLVILSDKLYSPIVPDCKCVYQMIKIFDLKEGRISSKTKEVFIYPCRANEFMVLNDDLFIGLSDNRSHIVAWNLSAGQIQWRIRPNPTVLNLNKSRLSENYEENNSSIQTPIKQSSFLKTSIHDLVIDSVLVSADLSTLIVAYFSPFLCVFSLIEQSHIGTLTGDFSVLDLYVSAITFDGQYLIHNNFNDKISSAGLSLWNTKTESQIASLTVKNNILSVIVNNSATMVAYFEKDNGVFLWNIITETQNQLSSGEINYFENETLDFRLEFLQNNKILLAFNGFNFQIWNIENDKAKFIGKFQPDQLIQSYTPCLNDNMIAFVLKGSNEIYSLKLLEKGQTKIKQTKIIENYLERNGLDFSSSEDED